MSWSILALAHSEIELTDRNRTNEGGRGSFCGEDTGNLTLIRDLRCLNLGNISGKRLGVDDLVCREEDRRTKRE